MEREFSKCKRKLTEENRMFQDKWEEEYFVVPNKQDSVTCLICRDHVISKKFNVTDESITLLNDVEINTSTKGTTRVIHIQEAGRNNYRTNYVSTQKYTIITFIPKFLFKQFRIYYNIFFLIISGLQQIPDVSPTGRFTTITPLIITFLVSAVKEILEDFKRHKADKEINYRGVEVLKGHAWVVKRWEDVVVGEVVKIKRDESFPADLLLLTSSEPESECYIETANIDGETNLKMRKGLQLSSNFKDILHLKTLKGNIECTLPNPDLKDFEGTLKEHEKSHQPFCPDQLLLRGAVLRYAAWVHAVVVYTGTDTKLVQNSTYVPLKRSRIEKHLNWYIFTNIIVLLILSLVSVTQFYNWCNVHSKDWYNNLEDYSRFNEFYTFLTYIILYNNMIPISLHVTLELARYVQAIFINNDLEMYHKESDTLAMARTSNLNEELGQVEYVFSDKTGTLTQNVMKFIKCAVGNEVYDISDSLIQEHLEQGHDNAKKIKQLLTVMSVCHTVIPETINGKITYHSTSSDELALVKGAEHFGYVFESRTSNSVIINVQGTKVKYDILSVLPFTSDRMKMAMVVKDSEGKIQIFCKGADSVINKRLLESEQQKFETTELFLKDFATDGLRTLCFAYADISPDVFEKWKKEEHKAATSVLNRDKNLDQVYKNIERDLCLLGVTAVEDKLQDNVPETIATLLEANIKMWILTGDKLETAKSIGISCGLIHEDGDFILIDKKNVNQIQDLVSTHQKSIHRKETIKNCLIVTGDTLQYALHYDRRDDFLKLCIVCKSVICCRVSPIQKAEVVQFITEKTGAVTLAIGDGANDVPMIQKARVGVGISGAEGLQAACASDYSIAQFRYLARLLLVHGVYSNYRTSQLILYSFYKNICLFVINFWYSMYSGWSGQILFERWTMALYNVAFTALPPLAMGLFDVPFTCDMLTNPKLYESSQKYKFFNIKVFLKCITNGLWHSVLIYFLVMICFNDVVLWGHGKEGGPIVLGNIAYTYAVMVVCLKAALVTNKWTIVTHLFIWGSVISWFIFIFIYSHVWSYIPIIGFMMAGEHELIFTSPLFWFGFILITFTVLIPNMLWEIFKTRNLTTPKVQQNLIV